MHMIEDVPFVLVRDVVRVLTAISALELLGSHRICDNSGWLLL